MARTNYFEFLDGIAANNNRPWFQAHRAEYDAAHAQWLADLQRLLNTIATFRPELRNVAPEDCTYRIYRDVRFSPDKAPYKRHFGALISPTGRRCVDASFYLQIAAEGYDSGVYGGLWMPDTKQKRRVRSAIDANSEEFLSIAEALDANSAITPQWWGEALKTAPKGWAKDHPMIQYLRLNEWGRFAPMQRSDFDTEVWTDIAAEHIRAFAPLVDFINFSIHEDNAI